MDVRKISGLTPQKRTKVFKAGLISLGRLLRTFPKDYRHFAPWPSAGWPAEGEYISLVGTVARVGSFRARGTARLEYTLVPQGFENSKPASKVKVARFLRGALSKRLKTFAEQFGEGDKIEVRGQVEKVTMRSVHLRLLQDSRSVPETGAEYGALGCGMASEHGSVLPRYSARAPLSTRDFATVMPGALDALDALMQGRTIAEHLAPSMLDERDLPPLAEALRMIHDPRSAAETERARRRLAFEEMVRKRARTHANVHA